MQGISRDSFLFQPHDGAFFDRWQHARKLSAAEFPLNLLRLSKKWKKDNRAGRFGREGDPYILFQSLARYFLGLQPFEVCEEYGWLAVNCGYLAGNEWR